MERRPQRLGRLAGQRVVVGLNPGTAADLAAGTAAGAVEVGQPGDAGLPTQAPGMAPATPEGALAAAMDRHVGRRVRERRLHLGFSLEQLAAELGVTAQQARKYEAGRNAIPAGRLGPLAAALQVPMGWFFADLPGAETYAPVLPTRPRMLMDIVRNFERIGCADRRQALLQVSEALALAAARSSSPGIAQAAAKGG